MTNEEIIIKIEEIAEIANFCDKIEAVKAFESEYRKSAFYKNTKMPLFSLVKEYSLNKIMNFKAIGKGLQCIIDNLDVSKIVEILEKFTNMGKEDFDMLMKETQESGFKEVIKYFTK